MGYREPYNVSVDECAELFYSNTKILKQLAFLKIFEENWKNANELIYAGLTLDIHMPFHPQIKKKKSNHKRSHKAYKNFHPLQKKMPSNVSSI